MNRSGHLSLSGTEKQLRQYLLSLIDRQGLMIDSEKMVIDFNNNKEKIRIVHSYSRNEKLAEEKAFIDKWMPRVFKYFASGSDINPAEIRPYPVLIDNDDEYSALFRVAALWWSIPVSKGFGRRFRILIFDESNGKLFGLLALTDPVFNLSPRDAWIGWDVRTRERNLSHVMDANVLGAIPPYNELLGAKLVGLIAASDFVRNVFHKKYRNKLSLISRRYFDGRLAMITVTGALGRSSIYNRLRFNDSDVFIHVGYTQGYGHFHLANDIYEILRKYLRQIGDPEVSQFKYGAGPNYRFRVLRRALEHLGLPPDLLRHGIKRGVYLAPLASNAAAFLRGEAKQLQWYHRPLDSVIEYWRERWLIPRALRNKNYLEFKKESWKDILGLE